MALVAVTDHAVERYRQRVRGTLDPRTEIAARVGRGARGGARRGGRAGRDSSCATSSCPSLVYVCMEDRLARRADRRDALWRGGGGRAAVPRKWTRWRGSQAQPPRQGPVPGRRDHEGRPRGLLRGRGRHDAAARARPAAEPVALERRDRRPARRPAGHPQGRARLGRAGRDAAAARAGRSSTCSARTPTRCAGWPTRTASRRTSGRRGATSSTGPTGSCSTSTPRRARSSRVVREAALAVGERLREEGLEPFAMTTGSKGIHVVAPLKRTRESTWVREWARELGAEVAEAQPGHADHRVAQEQARGADPRRHRAQHVRPDRRGALRRARAAGRAGRHAAGLGRSSRTPRCPRDRGRCGRWASGWPGAAIRGRTSRVTPGTLSG